MKGRDVVIGILQVATGQAAGVQRFGATPQTVLSSLTPLVALLIVAAGLALLGSLPQQSLSDLLAVAIGLLAPLVLSFDIARRWGRGAEWLRFATAYCWCQWAAPLAFTVLLIAMAVLMAMGVPGNVAAAAGLLGMMLYGLWLHWFLAKHALLLSSARSLALVLIVSLASFVLISLPPLLSGFTSVPAPP